MANAPPLILVYNPVISSIVERATPDDRINQGNVQIAPIEDSLSRSCSDVDMHEPMDMVIKYT